MWGSGGQMEETQLKVRAEEAVRTACKAVGE